MTIVLGLDLARGCTGWAVAAFDDGWPLFRPTLLGSGTIETPSSERVRETRGGLGRRQCQHLWSMLEVVWEAYRPDAVAYEFPARPRHANWGTRRGRRGVILTVSTSPTRLRMPRVTPGTEFNAMRALALAEGWVQGWMLVAHPDARLIAVSVEEAKRWASGDPNASKAKVAGLLEARFGWFGLVDGAGEDAAYDRSDAASVAACALARLAGEAARPRRGAARKAVGG